MQHIMIGMKKGFHYIEDHQKESAVNQCLLGWQFDQDMTSKNGCNNTYAFRPKLV